MPMVLAGVAALGLVVGAAAWLWPRSTAPSAALAGPRAASQADLAKAAPVAEPRPETTNLPVTAFTAAPESTPAAAPLPAPPAATQATQATAKPPPALATAPLETAPTQAAAILPAKRASAPTVTPAPGKRGAPLNDKDGALLPKPAEPAAPAPVVAAPAPAPPPPSPAAPPAPAPVTPVTAPAATTVASPSERCSDQDGFARSLCVGMVCGKRELHDHPECVAIRRR